MATATGLTKERMLEIEANSVVDGEVVDGHLHLIRHSGFVIDAGDVRGPAGPGGGGSGEGFEYSRNFATASTTWDFPHNHNTRALTVMTWDNAGVEIQGDVSYPDNNTLRVTFYYPQTGSGLVWD